MLAEHPRGGRFDALWLVGGRVVDWVGVDRAALDLDDLARRTADALRHDGRPGGTASLTPDDVDEARLVATWLARGEGAGVATLGLRPAPSPARLAGFLSAPPPRRRGARRPAPRAA